MTRPVVPIANLSRRIPEAGRIRIGVRAGKAMKALDTFRFTSSSEEALQQIAATYGGDVKPWSDPKAAAGQFEVITAAAEIAIILPPDPLGGTPIYEQWSGGGCQRRCDGLTCTIVVKGPEGAEQNDVPCLCAAKGEMACEPHTRLSVLLPDVRFVGTWRLDTKGWNAAQEMPGMVDLIQSVQDGLTRGVLRLVRRKSVFGGETRNFVVPVLGLTDSVDALAAGAMRVGALGMGPSVPALESASEGEDRPGPDGNGIPPAEPASPSDRDDDIVDAVIVEDKPPSRTLLDVLPEGVSPSRALVIAQGIIREQGGTKPTACEQVTDYKVQARVLDELGLLEAGGA